MALDNRSEVRKVLLITLLLNLFVMGLKAVVGSWTGSLSLQADALHSVTDSANNVLGLIASRFSSPNPIATILMDTRSLKQWERWGLRRF